MKASVIIPTKNPGDVFKEVLPQVLDQQTDWEFEVLVIDSGSTDGTVEYCKSFTNITLHEIKPEEFGHGKTRNLGISMTSGEFVIMLTHDAKPYDTKWLQHLVDSMTDDPKVAGSFGRHEPYADATPFISRDLKLHFDGFKNHASIVSLDDKERYENDEQYRQFLHFFSDNNSCIRRSVWEQIPYPDVDFAEDQIWAKTIIEAGYKKAYADNAVVYHSHTFGPWENFRRSFDESYAFLRLFGYKLGPSILNILIGSYRQSYHDAKYMRRTSGFKLRSFYWTARAVFDNFAKHLGNYMGQRALSFPSWFINRISRDRSLKNG
ncbi:MAG: glycosyltransferase [Rickettsiales bacterium]|nr:glycosyltransferase [Rickettsiales bacterium]